MQRLTGYTDALVARPGDRVALRVSSPAPWRASLVRLRHGAEEPVPTALDGRVLPAGEHPVALGSWLDVPGAGALPGGGALEVRLFVTRRTAATVFAGGGLVVALDATGAVTVDGAPTGEVVPLRRWHHLRVPCPARGADGDWRWGAGLDGKLDRPLVRDAAGAVHAAWDLAHDPGAARVRETGPHGLHGVLHGAPARAVTSHDWTGDEDNWRHAPEQWSAVHLHADDLEDAGWPAAAHLDLPARLPSGAYAVRLETDAETDHLPLVVAPAPRAPDRPPVVVLLPTFTYRAYADEAISPDFEVVTRGPADERVLHDGLLSQYNRHADGSGVIHASVRRPLLSVRPGHVYWLTGQPHGLSADLHLLEWLRREGIAHDVVSDELLHEEGAALLAPYRVLLSGSHPEYVTREQQLALRAFRAGGGRLMYLGGNGFQLVCGVPADRPWLTEVRRTDSHVGLWQGDPGETHLASTGEPGGHWALRRERPRELVGVDLSGMGWDGARPYERTARAAEPDVAWVFDGVPDGPIGTRGLVLGGAAGYEVDSADVSAGTPPEAVVLATARGFGPGYVAAGADPDIRADLVLGDGVFATGSIAWCGSLLVDDAVSRVTGNVLARFAAA